MYIGIDVGGMSIKAGIVTDKGKLLFKNSVPTPLGGNDEFCKAMGEAVDNVLSEAGCSPNDIDAIGVGAPGIIDRENCRLVYSCNIHYENAPVGDYLKSKYGTNVIAENDANCAAVGEYYASENAGNIVFITLGTGIGGGIIIDGRLYSGSNGAGAELGHTVTHAGGRKCGCGRCGCWEAYASTSGLIKLAEENRDKLGLTPGISIDGITIFNESEKGNLEASRIINEWIGEIGIGLTNMVNIFQPDEIIIGGAVCAQGDVIMEPVRKYVYENEYTAPDKNIKKVRITASRLGGDAGIIGAALLWKNKTSK